MLFTRNKDHLKCEFPLVSKCLLTISRWIHEGLYHCNTDKEPSVIIIHESYRVILQSGVSKHIKDKDPECRFNGIRLFFTNDIIINEMLIY